MNRLQDSSIIGCTEKYIALYLATQFSMQQRFQGQMCNSSVYGKTTDPVVSSSVGAESVMSNIAP